MNLLSWHCIFIGIIDIIIKRLINYLAGFLLLICRSVYHQLVEQYFNLQNKLYSDGIGQQFTPVLSFNFQPNGMCCEALVLT